MSSPRAASTTSTAGAPRRPRHGYFRARVLLDVGFAVFAVSAFVALALNGGAGYAPPAAANTSPVQQSLPAPIETGQSVVVADAGSANRAGSANHAAGTPIAVRPTPLVAPVPAPTPAAAVVAGSVSLVGLAVMLAGLITALVDVHRRRRRP